MQSCSSEKKIGFSDSTVTLIAQGAEARIFSTNFYGKPAIIKERFRKKYRHFALDELLTKERMRAEIRGLMHCRKLGIPVPPIYFVDSKQNSIIFGAVEDAITLKNLLDSMHEAGAVVDLVDNLALTIGQVLAKMHMNGVIHGDLTTSNLLVKRPLSADNCRQIVLIDFGLSFVSSMVEDKAVDLLVLEKAFMSTHPNAESFYRTILDAYAKFYGKQGSEVLAQLEQVRLRGLKVSTVVSNKIDVKLTQSSRLLAIQLLESRKFKTLLSESGGLVTAKKDSKGRAGLYFTGQQHPSTQSTRK
ncbi:EKC/KEOPS complex subunit TP53RK [Trichinella pseudospiralis]